MNASDNRSVYEETKSICVYMDMEEGEEEEVEKNKNETPCTHWHSELSSARHSCSKRKLPFMVLICSVFASTWFSILCSTLAQRALAVVTSFLLLLLFAVALSSAPSPRLPSLYLRPFYFLLEVLFLLLPLFFGVIHCRSACKMNDKCILLQQNL